MNIKNLKKTIAAIAALAAICATLTACGAEPTPTETTTAPTETTAPVETTAPETTAPVETTTPETTAPETTAPTETTVPETTAPAVLSDNPFDFMFSINGTVLQLPCTVADLEALGFKMEKEADNTLDEGYATSCQLYNGDSYITLTIYNNTDDAISFADAPVDCLSLSKYGSKGTNTILIAGGIGIGSTMDEVLAAYGEPTKSTTGEGEFSNITYLTYNGSSHRQKIYFQFVDGIATMIDYDSDAEYQR